MANEKDSKEKVEDKKNETIEIPVGKYVEKIRQAQDRDTPAEVLALLAQDQNADVRRNVARNTST